MTKREQLLDAIEVLNAQYSYLLTRVGKPAESSKGKQELLERASYLESVIRKDYKQIQSLTRRLHMMSFLSMLALIVAGVAMYVR